MEMDKEEKKINGQYNIDLAHMRAEIAVKVIKYAKKNNFIVERVLHDVLDDLVENTIKGLESFEKIANSGNRKDIMAAVKKSTEIREEKLRNGDYSVQEGKIKF